MNCELKIIRISSVQKDMVQHLTKPSIYPESDISEPRLEKLVKDSTQENSKLQSSEANSDSKISEIPTKIQQQDIQPTESSSSSGSASTTTTTTSTISSSSRSTRSSTKFFACGGCEYRTNYCLDLEKHVKIHNDKRNKNYACNDCDYRSAYSNHLMRHMKIHTGDKPYACDMCSFKCNVDSNLKRHILKVHSVDEKGSVTKE